MVRWDCTDRLGYENKIVSVQGQFDPHAISLHPPGRAVFHLNGKFARFTCQVALNDDVPAGRSWADFSVRGDGRLLAVAAHVVAGDAPRSLEVDVRGVDQLELNVDTDRWDFCHAVWLHPRLDVGSCRGDPAKLSDRSERVRGRPESPRQYDRRLPRTSEHRPA